MSLLNLKEYKELIQVNSNFEDLEKEAYIKFLKRFSEKPFSIPIIYSQWMKTAEKLSSNPQIVEAIKKAIDQYNSQNKNKSSSKFEKLEFSSNNLEFLPLNYFISQSSLANVITKRAQSKLSIRDLIYELFPLYGDDPVFFQLKCGSKVISKGEGLFKELKVPAKDLSQIPQSGQIVLLSLDIQLKGRGDNRRRHEENSFIFETDKYLEQKLSNENFFDLFKKQMSQELIIERAKLFNTDLSKVNPEDFYQTLKDNLKVELSSLKFKSVSDIQTFWSRFNLNYSNETLLTFPYNLSSELKQNVSWLENEPVDQFLF